MNGVRPLLKDVEQETLDIAKVFRLLSSVDMGKTKSIDVYFTDEGRGYLNALASLNPNLFVVGEEKYLELKDKNKDLLKINRKLVSDNVTFKEDNIKLVTELEKVQDVGNKILSEKIKFRQENTKLKTTIDKLRAKKFWRFW